MKKLISLFALVIIFGSCTFGNESATGKVFGDYIYSIVIMAALILCGYGTFKYYTIKKRTGLKDSTYSILMFIGAIAALAFFLFAKFA